MPFTHRAALKLSLIVIVLSPGFISVAQAATPSVEEMWQIIQQQQKRIGELQARLDRTDSQLSATDDKVVATASTLELTADAVEQISVRAEKGPEKRTTLGGYGELHYNRLRDANADTGGDDDLDRSDFHRFVLFFGHAFSDNLRFFSELEVEHAFVGENEAGEVELEQAWLEMDVNARHRIRAGVDILPIGIINPTHEPNTFYGVERNRVETEIIPATWWEAGINLNGELVPGWNYDAVLHTGLVMPTTGSSALRPRSGRLSVAEADDQDLAFTGRIRYSGMPGLEVGVAGQYQADVTGTGDAIDISATLVEAHVDWHHASGLGLRALYARWDFTDDPLLDPDSLNAGSLDGFYIEPSYRFPLPGSRWGELGIFARYSSWDERNQLNNAHRFENLEQVSVGFNWWPEAKVVLKFDAQFEDAANPVDHLLDGINLGIGYQF